MKYTELLIESGSHPDKPERFPAGTQIWLPKSRHTARPHGEWSDVTHTGEPVEGQDPDREIDGNSTWHGCRVRIPDRRITLTELDLEILVDVLRNARETAVETGGDPDFIDHSSEAEQRQHQCYIDHVTDLESEFSGRLEEDRG